MIITALRPESRPIIEALGLKHDPASRKIPVYSSGDALLVISGIGKLYAGIATTHAIHLAGNPGRCHLINVGMCGAVVDEIALGQAVLVHKIEDYASGREFFPDMLVNHSLREASLGTFDKPVTTASRSHLSCDIVDMEASGIFQAGHLFLAPHQMLFLKVATDYLDVSSEDFLQMRRYYEQSLEEWLPVLKKNPPLDQPNPVLSVEQESFLVNVAVGMRLTVTQTHQLRDAALRFLVRGGQGLEILAAKPSVRPRHKAQRNQMFESMIRVLNQ